MHQLKAGRLEFGVVGPKAASELRTTVPLASLRSLAYFGLTRWLHIALMGTDQRAFER